MSGRNTGLGMGLDGLIPVGFDVTDVATPSDKLRQIAIKEVVTNPDQPRKEFDESALRELAKSIGEHGIIQPLVVTPHGDNTYRIVAGERRYRAAKIIGLKTVPAIIRNHKELEELEIALVENVQRVDLSPLEQAISIVRLRDQFSMSTKSIAKKLGKAETTISNIIRLLQLPKVAIESLQKNEISEGHARALLSLKGEEKVQVGLLNTIIAHKLSVRDAEKWVRDHKQSSQSIKSPETKRYSAESKNIQNKLGYKTKISANDKNKGSIQILFNNKSELEELIRKLS